MKIKYRKRCIANPLAIKSKMERNKETSNSPNRPLKLEKIPRQHVFIYILLIICTTFLIYFYSFPLKTSLSTTRPLRSDEIPTKEIVQSLNNENNLNVKELEDSLMSSSSNSVSDTKSSTISDELGSNSIELSEEFSKLTSQEIHNLPLNITERKEKKSTKFLTPKSSTVNAEESSSRKDISQNVLIDSANQTAPTNSTMEQNFLVFSQHCKIPDIDPFHPSILQYVEETPPLICKDQEPLTKTEGKTLIIDKEAAKKRHLNLSEFECKYMEISRAKEGSSDDGVGIGPKHVFKSKAEIKAEFTRVECSFLNKTQFYSEYHSFIHNKSYVEKRCKQKKNAGYSVLIIGIDAMSRMNMHRQLKKTSRYLLEDMEAIEMYGFNKVGDNTFPNLIPLLVGYDERELKHVCWNSSREEPLDKCNFMWKQFAKEGYRTLYAEDSPRMSSFNYLKTGFLYQPTDYYFRHFMLAYESELASNKQINTYACVGSVSETEAVLHWTELFASNFKDRPYFSFSWINSLTHDYLNKGSSADHMYERFFRTLHESGALNKTITIVLGDHGMRWGPIRKTYIGRLEERLPMLLIALPPDFKREHPEETKALKSNSHRLVTPFDLHATMVNILHLQENFTFVNPDKVDEKLAQNFTKRAKTLFQPIPEDRSCDDAFIDEHWCTCETSLPMDPNNVNVKKTAAFLIEYINSLLEPVRSECATLKLRSITDSRVWSPNFEHQGHSLKDTILTIIIRVDPSGAVFEGTVRISEPKMECELLGTVSRLNLYGNQSICVKDAILRKYCYCL